MRKMIKRMASQVRADAPRAALKGKSKKVTRGKTSVEMMEEEKPKMMAGKKPRDMMYGDGGMTKKVKMMGGKMPRDKMSYADGGKLNMVKNSKGEMVPDFAADDMGRMMGGGKTVLAEDGMNKISGYAKGKKVMHYADGGITMTSRGCGAARKQKFGKNG